MSSRRMDGSGHNVHETMVEVAQAASLSSVAVMQTSRKWQLNETCRAAIGAFQGEDKIGVQLPLGSKRMVIGGSGWSEMIDGD